jgi:chromosome segregation ATPase
MTDGLGKIDSILQQGEQERGALRQKGAEATEKAAALEAQLAELDGPLREAREVHRALGEKLVAANRGFKDVEKELGTLAGRITKSKGDRDALERRNAALQREVETVERPRWEKAAKERDAAQAEVTVLEQQRAKLDTQVKMLQSLFDKLTQAA